MRRYRHIINNAIGIAREDDGAVPAIAYIANDAFSPSCVWTTAYNSCGKRERAPDKTMLLHRDMQA